MRKKTLALLAIAATAVAIGTLSGISEATLSTAFAAQALSLMAGALIYGWYKEPRRRIDRNPCVTRLRAGRLTLHKSRVGDLVLQIREEGLLPLRFAGP